MTGIAGGTPPMRPDQRLQPTSRAGTGPAPQNFGFFRLIVVFGTGPSTGIFFYNGSPSSTNPPILAITTASADPYGNPTTPLAITDTGMPILIYSGKPALGNLIVSLAPAAGTDDVGNAYPEGLDVTQGTITGTTIKGTDWILNAQGYFQYGGTPAAGNLIQSFTPSFGTDTFGNAFAGGIVQFFVTANGQTIPGNEAIYIRSGSGATGTGGTSYTGLILAKGAQNGQQIQISNISATANLTFAAQATSNVAGGTANVLSPLSGAGFVWDAVEQLWYPL